MLKAPRLTGRFGCRLSGAGFTLMEIMIVVVILGVLAGLAVPNYFNMVERARENEATVNLQIVRTGQKIYALNHNGDFWNPGLNPPLATINATLNIDITTSFYDVTSIVADNKAVPKTFTATVQRNATSGGNTLSGFSIDQNGVITALAF